MMQAPAPPVHWTTYVQTFAVIASTVGTFVYVWFTYHIMKWAVGQGKAALDVARLTLEAHDQERLGQTTRLWDLSTRVWMALYRLEMDRKSLRDDEFFAGLGHRIENLRSLSSQMDAVLSRSPSDLAAPLEEVSRLLALLILSADQTDSDSLTDNDLVERAAILIEAHVSAQNAAHTYSAMIPNFSKAGIAVVERIASRMTELSSHRQDGPQREGSADQPQQSEG